MREVEVIFETRWGHQSTFHNLLSLQQHIIVEQLGLLWHILTIFVVDSNHFVQVLLLLTGLRHSP